MPEGEVTVKEKVAFVTGASRGIGKVCAIALAEAGFDVAITARTVQEGEARDTRRRSPHPTPRRSRAASPAPPTSSGPRAATRSWCPLT